MRILIFVSASLLLLSACTALPQTASTSVSAPTTVTTAAPALNIASLPLNEYLEQGIAYSEKGQFQEAIDALTLYVKNGGNSPTAFYHRGRAYNQLQMYDPALADLSRAVQLADGNADAYYERSKTYSYKNNWAKALTDSTKVLQINPQFSAAAYLRAIASIKEKQYGNAVDDLNRAGYIDINEDIVSDLKKITDLAIPLNDLVLLKLDVSSTKTGTCVGGTCSAPISYNITVRVIMFANPDKAGIFITGANISPQISWLSEVQMRGSVYNQGMETLATNLASAQEVSGEVSCSLKYKTGNDSKARESNTVTN